MSNSSDCPGRWKCHGPASWCDKCGDVDLICNDPRCEAHPRFAEKAKEYERLESEVLTLTNELARITKQRDDAQRIYERHRDGNPVMVNRKQPGDYAK